MRPRAPVQNQHTRELINTWKSTSTTKTRVAYSNSHKVHKLHQRYILLDTYIVFTCMPGESYWRQLGSLLLCLCDVFLALMDSLVCWFLWDTFKASWPYNHPSLINRCVWLFTWPDDTTYLYQTWIEGLHTKKQTQREEDADCTTGLSPQPPLRVWSAAWGAVWPGGKHPTVNTSHNKRHWHCRSVRTRNPW